MASAPHSPPSVPARLSALYQYHNAPEVAPAHGLEYDDTVYPTSDKFPVVREAYNGSSYKGKHAFDSDSSRPPRIIFGLKIRPFLVVLAIMILVVVGAVVGGAVGGKSLRSGSTADGTMVSASNASAPTTTSSTFSAPTPTYTPLSDCPASNDTAYTSTYALGGSGTVPASAALNFTRYCDLASPLASGAASASQLAEAFVYSFSDCIEVCAGLNFYNAGSNCTFAVYQPKGSRPGNCWVGHAAGVLVGSLDQDAGTDVALLSSSS